jgi:hypothetical protein
MAVDYKPLVGRILLPLPKGNPKKDTTFLISAAILSLLPLSRSTIRPLRLLLPNSTPPETGWTYKSVFEL